MEHDYRKPWQSPITKKQWQNFLNFTFADQDRPTIYEIITKHTNNKMTFAEIGYGQCYDFQQCFKNLHDTEKIIYHGADITEQFTKYALEKYPNYDFQTYNFYENTYPTYDITYTRATLEHQPPNQMYQSLENLLKRTKQLSIISWFTPPSQHEIQWTNDGFDNVGAYCNTYDQNLVNQIIKDNNFTQTTYTRQGSKGNTLYIYELHKGTP